MSLPRQFPPLPEPPSSHWHPNIRTAHATLASIYEHALRVLDQEDTDPLRLAFHIDTVSLDGLSLLQALEMEGQGNSEQSESVSVPDDWLHLGASVLGKLVKQLHRVKDATSGQYVSYSFLNRSDQGYRTD